MSSHTRTVAPVPLLVGSALLIGAVGLLTEDAWRTGHVQLNHLLQPLLMVAAICAGVTAHHRLARLQVSGLAFAALAVLASASVVYATLSRTATARDTAQAEAMAENRTLALKDDELAAARAAAKAECKTIGPRCTQWQARVDKITAEMAGLRTVSTDPRGDSLAKLAELFGQDGARVRAIVAACDPLVVPLTLELSCILFFSAAFPRRRNQVSTVAGNREPTVLQAFTREQALADFRTMREVGAQQLLAQRWGRDEGTVSRWLQSWAQSGEVQRRRDGKCKTAAVLTGLPGPRTKASR